MEIDPLLLSCELFLFPCLVCLWMLVKHPPYLWGVPQSPSPFSLPNAKCLINLINSTLKHRHTLCSSFLLNSNICFLNSSPFHLLVGFLQEASNWYLIIFWPKGLLTFYDSDKGLWTIRLIFSKSNYFKVWCHPRKVLIKLHSYRAEVQWVYNKERIYYLKSLKLLAPRPLLIFSMYQLY